MVEILLCKTPDECHKRGGVCVVVQKGLPSFLTNTNYELCVISSDEFRKKFDQVRNSTINIKFEIYAEVVTFVAGSLEAGGLRDIPKSFNR